MTDKGIKLDIPTLKYVSNDLYTTANNLRVVFEAGLFVGLSEDAYSHVVASIRALGQQYGRLADEQRQKEKERAYNTKAPEPYQPPPVESKQTRRIRTKLDALQPLPKGTPVGPTPRARPRDFMAQAVSMALAGNTWPAARIRHVILHEPACGRWLLRQPPLQRIQETLSDHSRDPKNPRFIRVRQGWYKNNPKYKKAR